MDLSEYKRHRPVSGILFKCTFYVDICHECLIHFYFQHKSTKFCWVLIFKKIVYVKHISTQFHRVSIIYYFLYFLHKSTKNYGTLNFDTFYVQHTYTRMNLVSI